MPLSAVQPTPKKLRRLKMFLYGGAGCGKTTAAINMPAPYIIDSERGTEHYADTIISQGGAVLNTVDLARVTTEVKALSSEKHPYKTLVIDPISVIESAYVASLQNKYGEGDMRVWLHRSNALKRLYNMLVQLDMNVVITAHGKTEYGNNMAKVGTTFDGWRNFPFMFDLVIELQTNRSGARNAFVSKSRLSGLEDKSTFAWSIDELKKQLPTVDFDLPSEPVAYASEKQVESLRSAIKTIASNKNALVMTGISELLTTNPNLLDLTEEYVNRKLADISNVTRG